MSGEPIDTEGCSFCNGAELVAELDAELAGAWVPAAIEAGAVLSGDTIVGKDQVLWSVTELVDPRDMHGAPLGDRVTIAARSGERAPMTWPVPRDRVVKVLVPYPEREALILARAQLGAQIIRRTTGSGS